MRCLQVKNDGPFIIEDACLICGTSFVYDAEMSVFYNNIDFNPNLEYLDDEIARKITRYVNPTSGEIDFEFAISPRMVAALHELAVPLSLLHYSNYFHFLIQALPTLAVAHSDGILPNDAIIVSGPLKPSMRSALDLVIGKSYHRIELAELAAVKCDRALLARCSYHANELISGEPPIGNFLAKNITLLRDILLTSLIKDEGRKEDQSKLFIYRKSQWRNLINIDELADLASRFGYRVLVPEVNSFEEQVAIFNGANKIIGPTGAWMANLIFSKPDTIVNILYPDTMKGSGFWDAYGTILNIRLTGSYCSTDLPQNPAIRDFQPMHSNFYLAPQSFACILNEL